MATNDLEGSCLRSFCAALFLLLLYVPHALAQSAATGINGVYDGTYTCAIGPRTLKLSLQASGSGSLTGIFTFYLPPVSHTHPYSYSLKGTFDAASGGFTLTPVKWETAPPGGYAMVGMEGTFDPRASRVSGKITYAPCSVFLATRNSAESANIASAPPPIIPQPSAPSGPATAHSGQPSAPPSSAPPEPATPVERGPVPADPGVQPDAASRLAKLKENIVAANAALKTGDFETAVRNLKEAAQLDPTNAAVWANLGFASSKLVDSRSEAERMPLYADAANAYASALKLKPDDVAVVINYSSVLGQTGRIAEARTATDKVAQLDPSKASQVFYNLALNSFRAGENRGALAAASKISQSAPEYKQGKWLTSIATVSLYIDSAPSGFQDLKGGKTMDDAEVRREAAKSKLSVGDLPHFVDWNSNLNVPGGACSIDERDNDVPSLECDFGRGTAIDELRHTYETLISMVHDALGSHAADWKSSEVPMNPGEGLKHFFHGPQADVRVEIYRSHYVQGDSDPHPYTAAFYVMGVADAQGRAQAEARLKENVCISDDMSVEWRNPPAGGKMEKLKQQLVASLRERGHTSSYDQTRWIVVDSGSYPAWNPGTSFGKFVSTQSSGSCAAGKHREILALTP